MIPAQCEFVHLLCNLLYFNQKIFISTNAYNCKMNVLVIDLKTLNMPEPGFRQKLPITEYENVKILEFNYIMYDLSNKEIVSEGSLPVESLKNNLHDLVKNVQVIAGYNVDAIVKILLCTIYGKLAKCTKLFDTTYLCTMRSGGRLFGLSNNYLTPEKLSKFLGIEYVPSRNTFNCLVKIIEMTDNNNKMELKYEKMK
jgi:hypothetical protein